MTIAECYQKMGGNYSEVSTRLPSNRLIEKFVFKFLEDKSFEILCGEIENGNRKEAFRAAHTLKGVCANLSFTRLLQSVTLLTEELRPETDTISDGVTDLFANVREDYRITVNAIHRYMESQG